jgi:hypothetical protein
MKQIRDATILFENTQLLNSSLFYATDLSPSFDEIKFTLDGSGLWGSFDWGSIAWGGAGSSIPLRTLIPIEKQRCRYIRPRYKHQNALFKFSILGISLIPSSTSERAYR